MSTQDSSISDQEGRPSSKKKDPAEIVINLSWCKGCGICVDYCRPEAITMDGPKVAVVSFEKCTRCKMCEAVCPDFAIEIDPLVPMNKLSGDAKESR